MTTTYADARAEIRSILEYAPLSPGPIAPNLRGWWLPVAGGDAYLCARCAGRLIGRGFHLPGNAEAVWTNEDTPYGVCAGCE